METIEIEIGTISCQYSATKINHLNLTFITLFSSNLYNILLNHDDFV